MEKDIDRIAKNPETDIVIRVDDFGGHVGVTIREFVKSERYTGFTKAGTRIPADKFTQFKKAINAIDEQELAEAAKVAAASQPKTNPAYESKVQTNPAYESKSQSKLPEKSNKPAGKLKKSEEENYEETTM